MSTVPTYRSLGDGPESIVFLHGIGGDAGSFDFQLPAFAGAYRAVAWNMPGYGGSPLPEPMRWDGMADALAALLDRLGCERAIVVGHSMGGMVAQTFAVRHPARLRALVLSATSPAFGKPGSDFAERFLADRLRPLDEGATPADFADRLVAGMFADFPDPGRMAHAAASMKRLPAATYRAALGLLVTFDARAGLERIAAPTLCLAGGRDTTAPPAVLERMAAKLPGAAYRCIDGVGHLLNIERPDLFNRAVGDFLDGLG